MKAMGLNPYSTARKAGLGSDYVRNIFRGKIREPSATKLQQLAKALETSPEFLLDWPSPPNADWPPGSPVATEDLTPSRSEQSVTLLRLIMEGPTSLYILVAAEMFRSAMSTVIKRHLRHMDDEDERGLFGSDAHQAPLHEMAYLAHALGAVTDPHRETVLALAHIERVVLQRRINDLGQQEELQEPIRRILEIGQSMGEWRDEEGLRLRLGAAIATVAAMWTPYPFHVPSSLIRNKAILDAPHAAP